MTTWFLIIDPALLGAGSPAEIRHRGSVASSHLSEFLQKAGHKNRRGMARECPGWGTSRQMCQEDSVRRILARDGLR